MAPPVQVRVDLPENSVFCKVWRANVGRVPLYLLDTNLQENSPADRDITSRLYGGGPEMRIKQEIVLGIGGVRALEALNIQPTIFHMNEGHSAFLALERIRVLLEKSQLTFDQARQFVMATNVFTTHTPVPAGIDTFSPDMMTKYFKNYYPSLKLDEEGFLALGREDVTSKKQGFSMAVLAIRLADSVNGVSAAARRREPQDVAQPLAARCRRMKCPSNTSPTAFTSAPGLRRRLFTFWTAISAANGRQTRPIRSVWEGVIADSR